MPQDKDKEKKTFTQKLKEALEVMGRAGMTPEALEDFKEKKKQKKIKGQ